MRLIDADKLLTNVIAISNSEGQVTWSAVSTMDILAAPTVHAVPVVRCKDCKHRYSDSWCEYVDDDDNFYCARGEWKDGAN